MALRRLVDERVAAAHLVTREETLRRPVWAKLRDRAAWLALPYL